MNADPDGNAFHARVPDVWPRLDYVEGDYRTRRPIVRDLRPTDGDGRPLPFTLTSFPHRVELQTERGPFAMVFADPEVLLITMPPGRVGVQCLVRAEHGAADRRGAHFRGMRNVALTTNARLLSNAVEPQGVHYRVDLRVDAGTDAAVSLNITPPVGIHRRLHPQAALAESEHQWRRWFEAGPPIPPPEPPPYYYARWV